MYSTEGDIIENNDEYCECQNSSFLKKQPNNTQVNKNEFQINTNINYNNLTESYKEIQKQNNALITGNENDLQFINDHFYYNTIYSNNTNLNDEKEKKKEEERRRKMIEKLEKQIQSQKIEDISDEEEYEKYDEEENEIPWGEVADEGENMENLEDKIEDENKNEITVTKNTHINKNYTNQCYNETEEKNEISTEFKKSNENKIADEGIICVGAESRGVLRFKDNYIRKNSYNQTNPRVKKEINDYDSQIKIDRSQAYEKDTVNSNKFKNDLKSITFTENSNIYSPKTNDKNNNKEDLKQENNFESNLNSNYKENNIYNKNNIINFVNLNSNTNNDDNIEISPIKKYNYGNNNCFSNQNNINYVIYKENNFSINNSNVDNTETIYNNTSNNITDDKTNVNNISKNNQNSNYDMYFYESSKRGNENDLKQNKKFLGFDDLLSNKMFKKFLKSKIKKDNDKKIPKYLLNSLDIIEDKKIDINQNRISKIIKEKNEDIRNKNIGKLHRNHSSYLNRPQTNICSISNDKKYNNYYSFSNENFNNNINNKSQINFYSRDKFLTTDYERQKERNNLIIENKKLMNKIMTLQNEIQASKDQLYDREYKLKNYFDIYDRMVSENKINVEKIENLKKKLFFQRNEMKNQMNKIIKLEKINKSLKTDLNKLQKNFDFETSNNIAKQNYDTIKSNYSDIRNLYDLLRIKYQTLSDENYNYRRDKDLYEKQIKSKNEMIENLLEINSIFKKHHNEVNFPKKNNRDLLNFTKEEENCFNNDYIINNDLENLDGQRNRKQNKFAKLSYPELQSKRDELIREKKEIINIYWKIPSKTTNQQQINKRINLENKMDEIKNDLSEIKMRLKYYTG